MADPAAVTALSDRLGVLLDLGGPVVAVLLLMSVVGIAIGLLKLWQFQRLRITRLGFVNGCLDELRQGRDDAVLARLADERNPAARVMETAIRGRRDPDVPMDLVREEVTRVATGYLDALRSYLRGLEVIGSLAPLIGLLGTVLGMIDAFRQLEGAGSQVDPALLSGGIWEALLTTAVGLAVAIPAVILLNWFEGRVDRFRHRMEDAVTQVFTQGLRAGHAPDAQDQSVASLQSKRAADAH
ncbi:MotA/TolQ/ExbB proton channel family protein [Aquisalimonas sp. APHAB1-3]|uniref:MotA/TolQ/ExbB proton channel family protein n=1 Tax=unclassified Aquisalimonas TaxID=2644645 RepID=UPI0025C5ECE1|nr:MotA/TolQ/ExbB proton channel family protein [Aquisalimonas sp.]